MLQININKVLVVFAFQCIIGYAETSDMITHQKSTISVPSNMIRIALQLNIKKSTIYSTGTLNICSGKTLNNITCKGCAVVSSTSNHNGKASVNIETSKKKN